MSQPALSLPAIFTAPPQTEAPRLLDAGEGPANRSLAELSLLLGADHDAQGKWPMGRTVLFAVASCTAFWGAMAAAVLYLAR